MEEAAGTTASTGSRDALILAHLWLVDRIARDVHNSSFFHIDLDDLIQEGTLGLIGAAARFSPGKGASFETFSRRRIRGAMIDSLRRRRLEFRSRSIEDLDDAVYEIHDPQDSPELVAARLELLPLINSLKTKLPRRHTRVLTLRYECEMTFEQIGTALGITWIRAWQIHNETVKKIRRSVPHARNPFASLPQKFRESEN